MGLRTISVLMLGVGFLAGSTGSRAGRVREPGRGPGRDPGRLGPLRTEVADGELRLGRDGLPLALAGEVTALDQEQTLALRGPRPDPAAFLMTRPYLPRSVYIAVDGAAPHDDMAIGTRGPRSWPPRSATRSAARAGGDPWDDRLAANERAVRIEGAQLDGGQAGIREDACQTSARTAPARH